MLRKLGFIVSGPDKALKDIILEMHQNKHIDIIKYKMSEKRLEIYEDKK